MKRSLIIILLALIVLLIPGCRTTEKKEEISYKPIENQKTLVYFYGDTCPWCAGVEALVNSWEDFYKDIKIVRINKFAYSKTGAMLEDKKKENEWSAILEYYSEDIDKIYGNTGMTRPDSKISSTIKDVYVPFILYYDEKGDLISGISHENMYTNISDVEPLVAILTAEKSTETQKYQAVEKMIELLNPDIYKILKLE